MKYPVRARIIDATGVVLAPGLMAATPDVSRPHIGKEGLAQKLPDGTVRITLDDGYVLWGCECWWEPLTRPARDHGGAE